MRVCTDCKIEKPFSEFHKSKYKILKSSRRFYYRLKCKDCDDYLETNRERQREYRKNNPDAHREAVRKYRENNLEKIKERNKKYRQTQEYKESREKYTQTQEYKEIKRKSAHKYRTNKLKKDPLFKFSKNIRCLISLSLLGKGHSKNGTKTTEILGCTVEECKNHIEKQFKKGMNWKNHGKWHIDHIVPVDLGKTRDELILLNHYSNFQPLWSSDNISKSNKIIPEMITPELQGKYKKILKRAQTPRLLFY